ncbi:uncharacterized protein P884DRAFT_252900 [Thermothelomyces heterothallicus CBS 202.75]|uniref:uncharacterized protein n=1 Tax=Thermothelomyces heterothallicus CBS 202.75 TaxID=1149848 RepID=UPI0037446869
MSYGNCPSRVYRESRCRSVQLAVFAAVGSDSEGARGRVGLKIPFATIFRGPGAKEWRNPISAE